MEPTQLLLIAVLLGVFVGVLISVVLYVAMRTRDRHRQEQSSNLPEGVAAMLDGMEDAAAVLDTSFQVLATSTAAGWLGMSTRSTMENAELRALVRAARSSGVVEAETLRLRRSDVAAEPRLVSARALVLSPRLTFLTVRDISERERVDQMRHDFVSNTSHELKTPIGAVTLLAEAIELAADDPDRVRDFASRLSAEAHRLANLTGRILSLSRLQSADQLAEVRDVSVDEIVASAVDGHAVQAESARVELARGGVRGLWVRGDAQILTEAVGNLVANAIAYSPEGSRVGVGVKQVDDVVEIAVSDQGIGIADADQQRVFERFYRADQARSRRTGGTGLGLSIVKHAAQRHGGDVRLWSKPDRGSTFTIILPLTEPPAGAGDRKPAKRGKKGDAGKKSVAGKKSGTRKKSAAADTSQLERTAAETRATLEAEQRTVVKKTTAKKSADAVPAQKTSAAKKPAEPKPAEQKPAEKTTTVRTETSDADASPQTVAEKGQPA